MEFLKKNYEKILLAVVLLVLTVAACALPFVISSKRAALDNMVTTTVPHPKELPKVDMSLEDRALQRAQAPYTLDYTTKHNLLNPVLWRKKSDGELIKEQTGNEEGAGALVITAIKPLYLQITLGNTNGTGYFINIERQAAREDKRHLQSFVSKENNKTDLVTLQDVKGPADKPTELVFKLNQTDETFSIGPDKPFRKVEAYAADLSYPPERKSWADRRVTSPALVFAGGLYKIVAITDTNVVVSAESNKKKTTINFHPATEPR